MDSEENINITYRNKNIFPKSRSLSTSNSESLSGSTICFDNIDTGKSLPDLSKAMLLNEIDELKKEIAQIQINLDRTTNEVDNLNSENYSLQKIIQFQQGKIEKLRKLCENSSTRKMSQGKTTKLRKKIHKNNLGSTPTLKDSINNSFDELNVNTSHSNILKSPLCPDVVLDKTPVFTNKQDESKIVNNSENPGNGSNEIALEKEKQPECIKRYDSIESANKCKHRVQLFSDDNGKGVGKLLRKLSGSSFSITTLIKPGATTDKLLENCLEICKDFSKSDFIVVICGKNDKSPLKIQSALYYYIDKLCYTNVLLCDTNHTRFLRVRKLSDLFNYICTQFPHSKYVNINLSYNYNRYPSIISKFILRDILHINYKIKLAEYNNTIIRLKDIHTGEKQEQKILHNIGTQTTLIYTNTFHTTATQTDSRETFFRD